MDPKMLIDIIKDQQRQYVRESYGEAASECFTDDDLQKFKRKEITNTVREILKRNNEYLAIVIAFKKLNSVAQQKLLDDARNTYQQTWAEMGRISREGQTDAGQAAEKMIANEVEMSRF
jgi:hypothetical protein